MQSYRQYTKIAKIMTATQRKDKDNNTKAKTRTAKQPTLERRLTELLVVEL